MYMTYEEREEAREHADDDSESFVCETCGQDAVIVKRDFGIGAYEYWGSKGVHRDMRDCCSECGEEI